MNVEKIKHSQNFGFKLSDRIKEELDNERRDILKGCGQNYDKFYEYEKKRFAIEKIAPNLSLDCYDDFLLNREAIVVTVSDKRNKQIYENNTNYSKYGSRICVDSIFDFVKAFLNEVIKDKFY